MATATSSRPRPRPRMKQKQPSTAPKIDVPVDVVSICDSEDSDLTPLTSPIESKAVCSPLRQRRSGTLSGSALVTETPPKRQVQPQHDPDAWDIKKLGTYVWVLIDRRARVFDPEDLEGIEAHPERLWWPGKIKSNSYPKMPLKVRLFGVAAPGVQTIDIYDPCESNVIPLEQSHQQLSINAPTFVDLGSFDENIQGSPRKKQKMDRADIEKRWRMAMDELAHAREEDAGSDASMPEVGTLGFALFVSTTSPKKNPKETTLREKGKRKGKRRRTDSGSESEADGYGMEPEHKQDFVRTTQHGRWSPPPPDMFLDIPGELVLAMERSTGTLYWPAKILAYVPPKNARQEPKYQVVYLDGTKKDILRKWFYTTADNEFATCKLGEWESEYKEVENDEDEDNDTHNGNLLLRFPSPIPTDPPPDAAAFLQLEINEQFAYTKPVLSAILNENYSPARTRHNHFIAGGSKRKRVAEDAAQRGRMDPRDVSSLQQCLSEWCLRSERRALEIADEGSSEGGASLIWPAVGDAENARVDSGVDVKLSPRPPSPTGSEATLALSLSEAPPESSFTTEYQEFETSSMRTSATSAFFAEPSGSDNLVGSGGRQHGCEAYEELSRVEKVDYCTNVLLPEVVLQVLLWRGGHRTSVELLTDAEEETLHLKGQALLKESDWVNDILRVRASMERSLKLGNNQVKKSADGRPLLSVTGRPRRSVGAPRSYHE
ncbi:hypothetical protein FPV67DRAFT_2425 [Lyophyllum atratum]|nr:hypothetical protein FPV67DRAFT_2425 [Lyophyllum atratum]